MWNVTPAGRRKWMISSWVKFFDIDILRYRFALNTLCASAINYKFICNFVYSYSTITSEFLRYQPRIYDGRWLSGNIKCIIITEFKKIHTTRRIIMYMPVNKGHVCELMLPFSVLTRGGRICIIYLYSWLVKTEEAFQNGIEYRK